MKTLNDILKNIQPVKVFGELNIEILDIQSDSRKVKPGSVFIAISGTQTDGHSFIQKALESGARAIVCEKLPKDWAANITWIVVPDSAEAMGIIASNFYNNPSNKLILVGVTGTNGKTTIATLLFRLFKALGHKSGLISTGSLLCGR